MTYGLKLIIKMINKQMNPKSVSKPKAGKRINRSQFFESSADPIKPKVKCITHAETNYVDMTRQLMAARNNHMQSNPVNDLSITYVSHIKIKTSPYGNTLLPVLPLVFSQVKNH